MFQGDHRICVRSRFRVLDVPAEGIAAFKAAFAKGVYLNSHIRNRYAFPLE
ncbi:KTSC domain-containing protein [Mesorhizobium sp. M0015]